MAQGQDKAAVKAAKKEERVAKRAKRKETRGQMWQAFQMQRKQDKALIPLMLLSFRLNSHKFHPTCCVILNSTNYDTDLVFLTPLMGALKALILSIPPVAEIFRKRTSLPE